MRFSWFQRAAVIMLLCAGAAVGAEWRLAFEDRFQRDVLGDEWVVEDNAALIDGALHCGLKRPGLALINRPFAPDVRVEMVAEAMPGRMPCDLSIGLACQKEPEPGYGILAAFGGMSNTQHQIIGGGRMERAVIKDPPKLIEPGRRYRIAATKEGKRVSLEVDGEELLSAVDEDVLGGPGFDHVGVLTWLGMIVYEVKVFERSEPHPDTPRFLTKLAGLALDVDEAGRMTARDGVRLESAAARGVELFNAGQYEQAEQAFAGVSDVEVRAAGIAWCVGHVNYIEEPKDNARVGAMLRALADAHPDDARLADYGTLGDSIGKLSIWRFSGGPNVGAAVKRVLAPGPAHNPYYDKARFYRARFTRAQGMESGEAVWQERAQQQLAALYEKYPTNPSLRELNGERVPWGEHLIVEDASVPLWARATREAYARQIAILREWFTNRQADDGQLGGGWGDDVEILRDWGPLAFISNGAPEIIAGIERLCEGVWQSELSAYGFSPEIGDVEHAAEPSADTLPVMMALRYGDPLWIERNMHSLRSIRDYYTGTDAKGYRRFKSSFYGGDKTGTSVRDGGDSHYNTRTMAHAWWLAWYGNRGARELYLDWVDGWLAATMSEQPGKLAGVVPSEIWYPSGEIVAPGAERWYDDVGQYDRRGPEMSPMIQSAFLAAYSLTGEWRYLHPMAFYTRWTVFGPLVDHWEHAPREPGDFFWHIRGLQYSGHPNVLTQYWWLSGDETAEDLIKQYGKPTQRFLAFRDLDGFIESLDKSARRMRHNFLLMTKELLQTDRAGLPGADETYGAFTGGFSNWRDNSLMTSAVSWDVPHTDFGALVYNADRRHTRVWVYNFADGTTTMGLRLWRLDPGVYDVLTGEILEPDVGHVRRYHWNVEPRQFRYLRRGDTLYVDVPSGKPTAVDVRMREALEVPALAPDLALAERDLYFERKGDRTDLRAVVHNVGSAPARDIEVALSVASGPGVVTIVGARTISVLESPDDLHPRTADVVFEDIPPGTAYRVAVDPDNEIDELYKGNNAAVAGR